MKKGIVFLRSFSFFCFIITFLLFCLTLLKDKNPLIALDYKKPLYDNREEFDPSLIRLNTLDKLEVYCDSLFKKTYHTIDSNQYETNYNNLVSSVVRKRFYWGYSCYDFNNNYLALLFSKVTQWGYDAVVIPDDILKYPYAACSQQSIIMMELLKRKGFFTRKICFYSDSIKVGHFALEVFYNKAWHFRDPTLEPDTAILNKYNRPDIKFLTTHPDILCAVYSKSTKDKTFLDIFDHYKYGKTDIFPAPNALLFHKTTKFLSSSIYIFFLLLYFILNRVIEKKKTAIPFNP